MKKGMYIALIVVIGSLSNVNCQEDGSDKKNNLKISIVSSLIGIKLQYERTITPSSSIGITVTSYYHPEFLSEIKFEPGYRYYFEKSAQKGWYIEPKVCFGSFLSRVYYEEFYYKSDSLVLFDMKNYSKDIPFTSFGVALKGGQQMLFGKKKRLLFDWNFGFQYLPYNFKTPIINDRTYFDDEGNEILVKTDISGDWTYGVGWYLFGAGSIIYSNISLGYRF